MEGFFSSPSTRMVICLHGTAEADRRIERSLETNARRQAHAVMLALIRVRSGIARGAPNTQLTRHSVNDN